MKNAEKKITLNELKEMLENWKFGAQPASIQYITTPKINKAGKMKFGEVTKIASASIMIGYNYENSVNNQRERESELRDFMAQPLWRGKGKRVSTALSTHIEKGAFYLTYKMQRSMKAFHFDSALSFIPKSQLIPFMPKSDPSKYQGVEKAVYHREIALENVRKLKVKGMTFVIG